MNFPPNCSKDVYRRTNQEWVDALIGRLGNVEQCQAHEDLARYLYVVAYNDLQKQSASIAMLRHLAAEELATHAQDFVQDVLEKLAQNHFTRLHQFRGEGNFTSWAAQVMHHQIIAELRKQRWRQQELMPEEKLFEVLQDDVSGPETVLLRTCMRDALDECLAQLPERYRIAFVRRIIEHERADYVAIELQTTANAVNLMVFRARRRLQENLAALGLSPSA